MIEPLADLGHERRHRLGHAPLLLALAGYFDSRLADDRRIAGHHVESCGPSVGFIAGEVRGDFRVVVAKRLERTS